MIFKHNTILKLHTNLYFVPSGCPGSGPTGAVAAWAEGAAWSSVPSSSVMSWLKIQSTGWQNKGLKNEFFKTVSFNKKRCKNFHCTTNPFCDAAQSKAIPKQWKGCIEEVWRCYFRLYLHALHCVRFPWVPEWPGLEWRTCPWGWRDPPHLAQKLA